MRKTLATETSLKRLWQKRQGEPQTTQTLRPRGLSFKKRKMKTKEKEEEEEEEEEEKHVTAVLTTLTGKGGSCIIER